MINGNKTDLRILKLKNRYIVTQVKLLVKYDDVLKHTMSMPKKSMKYLSPKIQNEMIYCLKNKLRIYFKKDQLCEVYRYVNIIKNEKSEPVSIEIEEVFLGFSEVCDHSAIAIHNNNMDLLHCREQGYNGARVINGAYGGVQSLIKQVQPNALYVHCASHNLNLRIVEDSYTFFGSSINRWDLLTKLTEESTIITLKKLNPTNIIGAYLKRIISEGDISRFLEECLSLIMPLIVLKSI
ncbi:hypothetical protein AGLY_016236 [Aphis glycines]|uniref:DUF4371 domain-containing protein n=1 Tax=Aphis glycines TaxID=307491 RepID=A0A6G0SYR2_APHGL|nr:hypothetical protein AGLY_016236 [Aphis glycines]